MRFTVNKNTLLKELAPIQDIVEKKSTIPMLANVLLECGDFPMLYLSATDLDVFLRTSCEAEVHQPGSAVVNARKLFEITKLLGADEVDFTLEDNDWVRITCGDSDFKMAGMVKEHFPKIPVAEKAGITIPAALLNKLIARTEFAITKEESRYALQGALFTLNESALKMVATDGYRLSLAEETTEATLDTEIKVIIPHKALTTLLKLTAAEKKAEPATVELSVGENRLFVAIGNRKIASRMLAGQFPNYDLVIPKSNDKIVALKTAQFAHALKRAALMADTQSHGVKLHFEKGSLGVASDTADKGNAHDSIAIDYQGEKISIGFNAEYLIDFLDVVGTEEILFSFKNGESPALLQPNTNGQPSNYKYVGMPMRLM
jgi:DNA polymerase-3 subunit beta